MKHITTLATMFSLTLLIGCGGGGGGSTAGTGTPAPTGGAPTALGELPTEPANTPTIVVGLPPEDDEVPALSGLETFSPSAGHPTMRAVKRVLWRHRGVSIGRYGESSISTSLVASDLGGIGSFRPNYKNNVYCTHHDNCYTSALPGDTQVRSWATGKVVREATRVRLFNLEPSIADLSLVPHNPLTMPSIPYGTPRSQWPKGTSYFAGHKNSYTSQTETIGDVSFARGSLTGTRAHDNAHLEFQTFAGWLDGGIFGTTRIKVTESGRERYGFISYFVGEYRFHPTTDEPPSGTGSATWEGAVVASIKDITAISNGQSFIHGDATIDIDDLANPDVDLVFDNWHTIDGRRVRQQSAATTFYNVPIGNKSNFRFTDEKRQLHGWFHGLNQREVGGYFQDDTLAGAFGAVRQE